MLDISGREFSTSRGGMAYLETGIFIRLGEHAMNKAFVKETDDDDELEPAMPALPAGFKNYITPAGLKKLKDELLELIDTERP